MDSSSVLHAVSAVYEPTANSHRFEYVLRVAGSSANTVHVADGATADNGAGIGGEVEPSSVGKLLACFPHAAHPAASNYQFDDVA